MVRRTGARTGMAWAAGAVLIAAAWPRIVWAQQAAQAPVQQLQRVEVTGSSVRRIDGEAALPVQVITREDIDRAGATSVVDLFRHLPAMQGQLGHTSSLAGETFGYANVSLHNMDDVRTLVLINGHRVASFGGQTINGFGAAFDINAIPVSAIERIEILSDGASSIYGSDAIAGVVNVITRRNVTEGDVQVGFSTPRGGAREKRISASKGFGSLRDEGFNVFLSASHEQRSELASSKRPYARSAVIDFTRGGQRYRFDQSSLLSAPANAVYYDAGVDDWVYLNPYYAANGNCGPGQFAIGAPATGICGYDYVAPIQLYPEQRRDSLMASFNVQPTRDLALFADVLLTRSKQRTRMAPAYAYETEIAPGTALHDRHLLPLGIHDTAWSYARLDGLGPRIQDDTADFADLSFGAKGHAQGWDYRAEFAHSRSRVRQHVSNYVGLNAAHLPILSGAYDPFVPLSQQTPAGLAALNDVNYSGYWNGGTSTLDTASLRLSRDLASLAGGPMVLGTGVTFTRERFRAEPGAFAQGLLDTPAVGLGDLRFDQSGPVPPYGVSRQAFAAFGELVLPVARHLELTASARHDHYSDFGDTTNLKGSFRVTTPARQWLVRGSLGTGFRAPSAPQRGAPVQSYGLTRGFYDCTPELQAQADALGAQCRADGTQYNLLAGGNSELGAERSLNASLGLRFEPVRQFSIGADWWFVRVRDGIRAVAEDDAFLDPARYPELWSTVTEGGTTYLAFVDRQRNMGKSYTAGVDVDVTGRMATGLGELGSQLLVSSLLRDRAQSDPSTGAYASSVGNYSRGYVAARWRARWATSLRAGDWTHTVTVNGRSGYRDTEATVTPIDDLGNPTGPDETLRLKVKRFFTADWQTDWQFRKDLRFTVGLLNLFDRDPPLSLSTTGLNQGQQIGFDDRYYDPRGRTFYANLHYKF